MPASSHRVQPAAANAVHFHHSYASLGRSALGYRCYQPAQGVIHLGGRAGAFFASVFAHRTSSQVEASLVRRNDAQRTRIFPASQCAHLAP